MRSGVTLKELRRLVKKANSLQKNKKAPVGWGDRIATVTKALGIKECGGCKKRREFLNKLTS